MAVPKFTMSGDFACSDGPTQLPASGIKSIVVTGMVFSKIGGFA
jgi:hypothetical protein